MTFKQQYSKQFPTGISGIKNGIGIPLPMGVPEIGTKNFNFQPSNQSYERWPSTALCIPTGLGNI
jgi:hypothetical protein